MDKIKNLETLKKKYIPHLLVLFVAILTCSAIYFSTLYYEVNIDGKVIGVVKNKKAVYNLIEDMKTKIQKEFKKDVTIDQKITFNKIRGSKDKLTSSNVLKENLNNVVDLKTSGYAISVNGKDVVFLKDEKSAQTVLSKIKNLGLDNSQGKSIKESKFMEKVEIKEKEAKVTNIKNSKEAYNYLLTGSDNIQKYIVKNGDTLWTISKKYNFKMEDIQKSNPDINIDKLKLDQEINITVSKPYLNVKVIEVASYEEVIPYQTTYEETDALYKGEKKLKIEGIEGKKKVEAEITKINGQLASKNITKEEVIQTPSDKVILQGTKQKPLTIALGVFSNPSRGKLTSRFGARWGRAHTGIDIAGPIGTPINAADGGTVSFAGKQGAYGNLVIIDHGNGYKTYYGHCSKLIATKGQKVAQGELIAKVGNTGRSTGPHLHFEVRIKGTPVNPLKYVSY